MGCAPSNTDGNPSIAVSQSKLEKAGMTVDDWMMLTNRGDRREADMVKLLDWFIKQFPSGGISALLYKQFFPATETGQNIASLVFRLLDDDNGGTIGFPEINKTLDLCNAKTFPEQVSWAFRIFDCDNSKSIGIEEFGNSVKEVWKIFDGIGETEYNPGDPDKIADDLVNTCKKNNLTEVEEAEFVRISTIDKNMGNNVVNIYRSFIGCWSFLYERWASGVFFTQTKPPTGPFWDKMNEEMFSNLSFHTVDPEEEERINEAKKQASDAEMAERIKASFKASEENRNNEE